MKAVNFIKQLHTATYKQSKINILYMGKTGFFGLQEIATALGVIIFSILLFSLVSTFQDRGGKTLDDFCARNPALPICKGDTATYVSGIAAYSTEALACGISSVAGGGGQSCLDKFSAEGSNIASANAVSFSGKATEDSKQKTDEFQLPMLDCPASNKYPEIIYKTDDYRSMKFRFNGNSWEYSVYSSFGVGTSYSSFYSVEENAPREYVDYANKAPFSDLIFGLKGDTEELGLKFLAESVNGQKSNYLLFNSAEGNEYVAHSHQSPECLKLLRGHRLIHIFPLPHSLHPIYSK